MRLLLLFFSLSLIGNPLIEHREHSEIVNKQLPQINFTLTYTCFDHFINEIMSNTLSKEELIEYIERIKKDDDVVVRYRSLLLDPSDPIEDYQRREDEFYFLYADATQRYISDLSFYKGDIKRLFDILHDINNKARWVFEEQIDEMENRWPGIKKYQNKILAERNVTRNMEL